MYRSKPSKFEKVDNPFAKVLAIVAPVCHILMRFWNVGHISAKWCPMFCQISSRFDKLPVFHVFSSSFHLHVILILSNTFSICFLNTWIFEVTLNIFYITYIFVLRLSQIIHFAAWECCSSFKDQRAKYKVADLKDDKEGEQAELDAVTEYFARVTSKESTTHGSVFHLFRTVVCIWRLDK